MYPPWHTPAYPASTPWAPCKAGPHTHLKHPSLKGGLRGSSRHSLPSFKGQTLRSVLVRRREAVPSRHAGRHAHPGRPAHPHTRARSTGSHTLTGACTHPGTPPARPPCSSAPRGAMLRPHPGPMPCCPRATLSSSSQVLVRLGGSKKTGRARDPPGPPSEAGRGHGGCSRSVQQDPAHLGPEQHSPPKLHPTNQRSLFRETCGRGQLTPPWAHHIRGYRAPLPLPLQLVLGPG